ncbi:proton-conducting transporter membrane subunit [Petroclostridium sp. X23]|uniref:complex I subunit 5 family protein n=1 Tax=Petroclostridium sp. X23 TaxID=3045146 RepID=UPI0024ADF2AB|nr:proton-conducting transporter membrane subunit [Petroclostridium sp. X23]WHH57701.1 proton-conducting transporter membrane subunit [Petroclostridium sp. X23]
MISLYFFILLPILSATLLYLALGKYSKRVAILLQIFLFLASVKNFILVKHSGVITESLGGWKGYVGIVLRADILSSVLVMLTAFLFLAMLIFNYSKMYVDKLFLFLFLVLQALIIGIFLSNDLFNVFILAEISTITISILIMFKKDSQAIYDGIIYLLVNIVAMTFFLFGIGFIYKTMGVLDFGGIQERMKFIEHPRTLIIPYALMITAVSLKCALMPLFSWLPKAHGTPSAPSIVSAILSGLYVKSGIYLFIRIQEMFQGVIDTSELFLVMGLLTGMIGFFLALSQTDLKLILAYHTVSQIGLIMIGLNFPNKYSYWGSIYHIVNHAFFKSTLFLGAGMIIEEYKTRNLWEIKGVFRRMPIVAAASVLAILGITGAPLFNGSISKYLIQSGIKGNALEYGILIINLGTIVSFLKYSSIFWGDSKQSKVNIDHYRSITIITLGLICFTGGVWGQGFIELLFNQQVSIDIFSYLQKAGIYLISLIAGVIIYKKIILKSKWLYRIKEFELDFNNICLSITIFLCVIAVYLAVRYM